MPSIKLRGLVLAPLVLIACSDAPTVCAEPELLQLQQQGDVGDWRVVADSLLSAAPGDSVLHVIVFLDPQAKQEFVDWAVSTGGGFGYGFTYGSGESAHHTGPRRTETGEQGGPPETVPGVMIRYDFSGFSGYSIYLPVWALEGLKEQNITGVEFGIDGGSLPLC
jgi:hypothetical protein